MPDQLNQNSGGETQAPIYLLVLFLFLIRIFKKFPSSFQCAAKIENHYSRWFWSSTSLETTVLTYPPGLFHLICYPDNIVFSLLLFFLLFHFVSKNILPLAIYLKGDLNNNISDVKSVILIWNLHRNPVISLCSTCTF